MAEFGHPLDTALDLPFLFRDRPASAPSDLRPLWRVPVIMLLISCCRGEQATHEQLHVLNWAVRSSESAESLAAYLAGAIPPEHAVVRYDPALDRAASLARGIGLIVWKGRYWTLTPEGRQLLEAVRDDGEVLAREKELLRVLPKPLTQAAVAKLLRRERETA
jgi:hypothetical protein